MKRYPSYIPWLLSLVAITLLIAPYMCAQVERTSSIQGTVKDPSGAVVTGAKVELTSTALFRPATISTDSSGYYRFDNLRPGIYNLTVSKAGFASYRQDGIDLAVGRGPTLDVTMKVGAATEIVEVTGRAPQIDVVQSKVQTNVTSSILANAPSGRSFQSVIQFAPGARAEPLQGGPNNGVLGYQIDGASNAENAYLVEGQETSNIRTGTADTQVPMEFTQEVVIKSSGFEAEHGGALGAIVNVIQKRGSNAWHGSVFAHYQGDTLDAAPVRSLRDRICTLTFSGACTSASQNGIPTAEYIQPIKDHYRILEPGFEVGGYLLKDKLWAFASTVPQLYRQERTVFMTGNFPAPGARTFPFNRDTYYSLARVDAMPWQKVHIYGSWQYNYQKARGSTYPSADDVFGAPNVGGANNNPDNYNNGIGFVRPSLILGLGGDVTITPNLVLSSRWGRFYTDYQDRGLPVGIRYQYRDPSYGTVGYDTTLAAATACTRSLDDSTLGTWTLADCGGVAPTGVNGAFPSSIHPTGYSNMGANTATIFDNTARTSFSVDLSYFKRGWGTHNLKVGYLFNQLSNNVISGYNTAQAYIGFDRDWVGSFLACDPAIPAYNLATWGDDSGACRGNWGSVNIREFGVFGLVKSYNHGFYGQDAWSVGHRLTLNLGVRFDKESLPSYSAGLPSINFGWTQKFAPRLGASYDVLGNSKLKIYGSFGYFYDIMKYDLPRGSFGGDYWHDCAYAMDSPDFLTTFLPTRGADGHFCPTTGGATGTITGGRFIANEDYRIPSNDPSSACDVNFAIPGSCVAALLALKPMKQHEIVMGVDWQIKPGWALETRWSRKRLDRTIEDTGILGPFGEAYTISNPGFGQNATTCATCPPNPKAIRRYDGLEFRLTKAASAHWFGQLAYTYSKLRGNYSGSSDTDLSDGGGGRQTANVGRAFDEPFMSFDAHGKVIDGPLATDRPHTFKAMGYYRLKWWKMETTLGAFQQWYSGSPLSTFVSVWGAPVFVEGRGNFVNVTAAPGLGQDFVLGSIEHGKRTPTFSQTDLSINQEMHVSKQNENLKLALTMTFANVFNQHSPTFFNQNLLRSGGLQPSNAVDTPNFSYPQLFAGAYNYIDEANGLDPWSTVTHRTLNTLYGQPYGWQNPRTIRFKVAFHF